MPVIVDETADTIAFKIDGVGEYTFVNDFESIEYYVPLIIAYVFMEKVPAS